MLIPVSLAAFAGVTILALCFLYVLQSTALRDLTAQCALAGEELVRVEEVNRTLEFRIGQAFSLERISRIAREQLGMVEPSVVRYVPLPASDG
jgi:hypothetical protein